MKNYYMTFFLAMLCLTSFGQGELIPGAVVGSCVEPDSNLIYLYFDYNKNCAEADPTGFLAGATQLGFHSGINNWATIVRFDDEGHTPMNNIGNDIFLVKINTMDYYGAALADIDSLQFLLRSTNPSDAWDFVGRDDQGGVDGFSGEPTVCNDFNLIIDNLPTCAELAQESSVSLFGATTPATSCIDTATSSVRLEFDLSLNCPEADSTGELVGASALGFQSGANEWSVQVPWDADTALQAINNGSDIFVVSVNPETYYSMPLDSLESIFFDLNNGAANPDNPWTATGKDERDGGFGGAEPCSNLRVFIDELGICEANQPVDTMPEPEDVTSKALLSSSGDVKTCVDEERGKVRIGFDLSLNCPEADTNMILVGASALGFHSGANGLGNDFTVEWNDSSAMTAVNNGSDIFSVTVNVMDYYGIEFDSLNTIVMVMNNGVADSANAWDATGKDERPGGFGGACSDLVLDISEAPSCTLPNEGEILSSPALLTDSTGTCMDRNFGLLKIGFDYALNCPDSDTLGMLDGAPVIGFHSGANNFQSNATVAWNDEGAKQAVNEGNNVFTVVLNPAAYYGLPLEEIENIEFLYNNGPAMPDAPWDATANAESPGAFGGNCGNLLIYLNELPSCDLSETATSHALFNGQASTCMDTSGMLNIGFDLNLNCPEADSAGLLVGTSQLGFHSGINNWTTQVAWDDTTAVVAENDGNDLFTVSIDPAAYYGTELDSISEINFLFNNGIAAPEAPWDNVGNDSRDNVGGFGASPCSNLIIVMSEVPSCESSVSVSVKDKVLTQSLRVYPNPAQNRFRVEFNNQEGKAFDLMLIDMQGKAVKMMRGIRGSQVDMQRGDLANGIYFLRLIDEKGNFATTTLMMN